VITAIHNPAPVSSLDPVIATPDLTRRPSRAPDYRAENLALVSLARHLSASSTDILQKLVETARELCGADSAGVSLVEEHEGGTVFRWSAIAGQFAEHVRGTTPRDFSPCGVVLDTNAVQLFANPGKHYTYLDGIVPPIVEALLQPFSVDGRPIGTIWVIAHDEHRKFDLEDARVLGSLATFAANAYQFVASLRGAREVERRKDEFLALLSHEMRSPLTAMLLWIRALRGDSVDPPTRERAVAAIERSTVALARMIDDLLDVSRIIAGKFSIEPQDANLAKIVGDAVEAMQIPAAEAQVELAASIAGEEISIYADSTRIQQVVGNLLANAIKFTPPGGKVSIVARSREGRAEVTVSDTGEGISADVLPLIFERFQQGDVSTTRRHGGLGLGLAVARHLVELHGGTIEASSDGPGLGSTFTVRLPAVSLHSVQAAKSAVPARLDGLKVLVVDDDPEIRLALEAALREAGAEVTTASCVQEAVERYASERSDVVITDLAMPDADGYELLRTLRARWNDGVPILALTGAAALQDRESVRDAGFTLHLTKPIEPAEVLTAVAMAAFDGARKFAEQRTPSGALGRVER
jgi:signal transduction histidine kinase/CheY-like chemotaxis protein